jgi:hypothetical protein
LQVGDVEGDKSEWFVAVVKLVAAGGDKAVEFGVDRHGRQYGEDEERERDELRSHEEGSSMISFFPRAPFCHRREVNWT